MKDLISLVKKLRGETGVGVMDCQKALRKSNGDLNKAKKILKAKGVAIAKKRGNKETNEGYIATYTHNTGKVAAMVELLSETDFVSRNQEFVRFAKDLCLQIASMNPKDKKEFLNQNFVKDPSQKVEDVLREIIAKFRENIKIGRFKRMEI